MPLLEREGIISSRKPTLDMLLILSHSFGIVILGLHLLEEWIRHCIGLANQGSCVRDVFGLVFPRDGTSRGTSRDKKKILSRCPVVPGQGQEKMSRDKLLCPGTSQDKMNLKIFKKRPDFLF